MTVLVISPFAYALEKKTEEIRKRLFVDDIECQIHKVKAFPDELEGILDGKQFDYMYIDINYIPAEVGKMREHLNGLQNKQIERF